MLFLGILHFIQFWLKLARKFWSPFLTKWANRVSHLSYTQTALAVQEVIVVLLILTKQGIASGFVNRLTQICTCTSANFEADMFCWAFAFQFPCHEQWAVQSESIWTIIAPNSRKSRNQFLAKIGFWWKLLRLYLYDEDDLFPKLWGCITLFVRIGPLGDLMVHVIFTWGGGL